MTDFFDLNFKLRAHLLPFGAVPPAAAADNPALSADTLLETDALSVAAGIPVHS